MLILSLDSSLKLHSCASQQNFQQSPSLISSSNSKLLIFTFFVGYILLSIWAFQKCRQASSLRQDRLRINETTFQKFFSLNDPFFPKIFNSISRTQFRNWISTESIRIPQLPIDHNEDFFGANCVSIKQISALPLMVQFLTSPTKFDFISLTKK